MSLTAPAFIAGILNQIIESPEYEKILKPKYLKIVQQKLSILNEMVHAWVRTDNFKDIALFYHGTLEDIEKGRASWNNHKYWSHQILMFRILLRPTSQTPSVSQISKPSSASAHQAEGDSHWYSTRNFCNEFNETAVIKRWHMGRQTLENFICV